MPDKVIVHGLNEFRSALKAVDKDLPKELRKEFKTIAEMVVGRVRGRVPRKTGTAAGSLKARATQKGAGIAFPGGGDRSKGAYYPWLDFGGTTGRGHSPGKGGGGIKRSFVQEGRYLYPTIAASSDDIGREAYDAVERVAKKHGFEVRG